MRLERASFVVLLGLIPIARDFDFCSFIISNHVWENFGKGHLLVPYCLL
jgi:hypothetical protein